MPLIVDFLATLTLLAHIGMATLALLVLFLRPWGRRALTWLRGIVHARTAALVVAWSGTLGSLYLSEVLAWAPCKLCWLQRTMLYPQALLLTFMRKDDRMSWLVPLNVVGAAVAALQVAEQRGSIAACGDASCAVLYSLHYGYISVPVMALTAFVMMGLLLWEHNTSTTRSWKARA